MRPRRAATPILLSLAPLVFIGCAAELDDDPIDPDEAAIPIGKADGSCLPDRSSDQTRGVLQLANDPAVSADELDAIGLSRRTASAIAAGRPYADLDALDRVPTVGPYACRTLRSEACAVRGACEPELRLWTWNVRHFPLTGTTVERVAGAMDELGAEVVGFQEVDSVPAFDQLVGQLPGWEGVTGEVGFDTRVALTYRSDRLRVLEVEDLFVDDSYRFPRPPLAVTFEAVGAVGTRAFTVVVVHLKAMTDAASQERRRQAVVELERWMEARRGDGRAILVVGDWNDEVTDAPTDNVFSPFLDDAGYVALTLESARQGGYSYVPYRRFLDHVIGNQAAVSHFLARRAQPLALDQSMPGYLSEISDHRPVETTLIPQLPAE